MTITLDVSPKTQHYLEQEAREAGIGVSDLVLRILANRVGSEDPWLATLNSGHVRTGVSLSNEQTSRDSIYEDI